MDEDKEIERMPDDIYIKFNSFVKIDKSYIDELGAEENGTSEY